MPLRKENHVIITAQVPKERCFGDIESGVRPFPPYTPEYLEKLENIETASIVKAALELGLFVFVTESDGYMFYAPEEINLSSPKVKEFLNID